MFCNFSLSLTSYLSTILYPRVNMFCPYSLSLTSYLSTIHYPRVNMFCPYSLSLTSFLSRIPYPRVTVFCPCSLCLTSYLSKIESISSKSAEAKQLAWQEIEQFVPPKQTRRPLHLLLSPSFFYALTSTLHCPIIF